MKDKKIIIKAENIKKTMCHHALKGGVCDRHSSFGCSRNNSSLKAGVFVKFLDITKTFRIGSRKDKTALSHFLSFILGRENKKTITALDSVSFSAEAGEIIGIIGKNGSGKSTFLRILAGIYKQDAGRVIKSGNIVSIIGLNVGLQERLTMRDNIFLCCSLFGLSFKETNEKFHSIVEFSELNDFLDTKVYQFSSGMLQRLAFSIAINCNPQILLLDEVFEVGDEKFKEKSSKKIGELAKAGSIVLLVSHDLNLIEKHCSRIVWFEKAKIRKDGNRKILKDYKKSV